MKTFAQYAVAVVVLLALAAAVNLATPSLNAANGGPTVTVANTPLPTQVVNLPAVQPVSGTVSIANLPSSQTVTVANPVLPVRNVDNPDRFPYQESEFAFPCTANDACNLDFATVPDGKRLVVTNVNGYVDVKNGTLPNCLVSSSFGGNNYATVFVPTTKGTVSSNSTRMVLNAQVLAYFGGGETPHLFCGLFGTGDSFPNGLNVSLVGHYVSLP